MAKKMGTAEAEAPDAGYPSSLRIPGEMRKKLEASATRRGRSLAGEILFRLANSLEDDERFGDLESQMFGRTVGDTIKFNSNLITERKRKAGENLQHAEWWREAADRTAMREKIIDAIENHLGASDHRITLPEELRKRVTSWISKTPKTDFKPEFLQAVFQLLTAGLESDPARKQRWNG